jgi:hypothetical protein
MNKSPSCFTEQLVAEAKANPYRSKVNLTAFAFKGEPSLNLMFRGGAKTVDLLSGLDVQLSPSSPT